MIKSTKVKIIGFNCSNGMKLRKQVMKATSKIKSLVQIELLQNNNKFKNLPVLIINNELISEGKVLNERQIIKYINNQLENC